MAVIQFFRGVDEPVVPDIRLTRSRDGRTGQALFVFEEPQALEPDAIGDITGMFLIDGEGELVTRDVKARFVNGKASAIEATYTWKSTADFERFMRFAESYADTHGLGYAANAPAADATVSDTPDSDLVPEADADPVEG
ncbi:photosystem II reaction center protein Psb28 [Cyanobium sp. ATX 6F1]|uniref:photosystem II reaction center protein Psb28 n=1 Tax=unclassified Cyanobium TaxID=2627006 RepID=UPI0020CF9428|nr:photosystem II reaction center protein Psb28 [Cyanobium sp. ATX 6F1]MCP9916167.1 photosystem II reaction center protein Psb28 [Cyanobium sp. ATX 6F1]